MNVSGADLLLQNLAFTFALVDVIVAVYILVVNFRHGVNRYAAFFLAVMGVNTYAVGAITVAQDASQALLPSIVIAMTTPSVLPLLMAFSILLFQPGWLRSRMSWLWWISQVIALLPSALTVIDLTAKTSLFFTPLDSQYAGGYVSLGGYTQGVTGAVIRGGIFGPFYLLLLAFFLYSARRRSPDTPRLLPWLLFFTVGLGGGLQFLLRNVQGNISNLTTSLIFVAAYGYAAFRQMFSAQGLQRGSLRLRLTFMVFLITIPLMAFIISYQANQSLIAVEQQAPGRLGVIQQAYIFLGAAGLFILVFVWLVVRRSLRPIEALNELASAIIAGDLSRTVEVRREDELGYLATTFNRMVIQLRDLIAGLEKRVAERTQELEKRSTQLEAAAQVARDAASIREIDQLLAETVSLVSQKFGFYHVGIFLLDEIGEYALLRAANSEGGQRMLAREHKLRVGQTGIVGYVAQSGYPRIALDVGADAVFFSNPDLPETRSEMALPLKISGKVIGVLDVQSSQPSAFTNEDINILQIVADQAALAIENARLFEESRRAYQELSGLYGEQTTRSWRELLQRGAIGFRYDRLGVKPDESAPVVKGEDDTSGEVILVGDERNELRAPIILHNQKVGYLILRREAEQKPWSQQELAVVKDAMTQITPALENARLLLQARRRAGYERMVAEIAGRVRTSTDIETILQTSVKELGSILQASEARIELAMLEQAPNGAAMEKSEGKE